MKKTLKRIVSVIIGIPLFLLLLWIAVGCFIIFYIAPKTDIKQIVENTINDNINSKSNIGKIDIAFFSSFPNVAIDVDDLLIYDNISSDTIFSIQKARICLNTFALLQNSIDINKITLNSPFINYYVDSTGNTNIDSLFKSPQKKQENSALILNNIAIREGRADYHDISTGDSESYRNLNFDFEGEINLKDSILDVKHGDFFIGKNSLSFFGHIDPKYINFTVTHDIDNLNNLAYLTSIEELYETDITGRFRGETHIEGEFDNSFNGITIIGNATANDINVNSSKHSLIVTDGELSADYQYVIGTPDSSYLILNSCKLIGEYLTCEAEAKLTHCDSDIYVNAHIKANGNLTELVKRTSLLSKKEKLQGNINTEITISSSLYDLLHKYRFPKSLKNLYDLNLNIMMPNVSGKINIDNLKAENDTLKLNAGKINISFDGNSSRFVTNIDNILLSRNGKVENTAIKAKEGAIEVDGNRSKAKIKITEAGVIDVAGLNDSIIVVTHLIDMDLDGTGKYFANGHIESFSYRRGTTSLFGAQVNGKLFKASRKSKKRWDTGSLEVYITRFKENNLDIYSKRMTGTFKYNGCLSNLSSTADSIHIKAGGNELYVKDIDLKAQNDDCYKMTAKSANTEKIVLGMGVSISNLNAIYNQRDKTISLNTGRVSAGNSDFSAIGNIDLSKPNPIVNFNLVGKNFDINEMIVAGNRMNLAMGNPNAIPLDSIPKGKLPRSGGKVGKNMSISFKMDHLTLTTLQVSNVTGEILMRDQSTLINNLCASDKGYKLCLNTKYTFINRGLSTTDILLDLKDLDITKLPTIIPSFKDVTPMLSALKGTVNLQVAISTPIRYFIGINMTECKAALTLEATNLSITDNEEFRKVAKTLMFKNKESTSIDSLAVAATIQNSQLKFYPFLLKVDRYNAVMYGDNDLITKQINYKIAILKSPIPFKFGIQISGIPKYQIKLVKSGYKDLDLNRKPWTIPEFEQFNNSLQQPIINFRNSIKP